MVKLSPTRKGYLLALASTLSLANVYIFSKASLEYVNLAQFGFYWFGFAIVWNIIYSFFAGNYKNIKPLTGFQIWNILGIGVMETIATVAIFVAINMIPNPTIPSMIRNLEPILIIIMSYFVLNEKHTLRAWIGITITILGTIIVSFNAEHGASLFIPGAWIVVIACLFYGFRTVWSKAIIQHIPPITLNLNKVTFLFVTAVVAVIVTKSSLRINPAAYKFLILGSLIGPFFTSFVQFLSLKYIDASRSTLVQSTTGMFTLLLSFLFFNKLPYGYQIFGGVLSIIGLALVILPFRYWIHINPVKFYLNSLKRINPKNWG